jgi:hypothetical protein
VIREIVVEHGRRIQAVAVTGTRAA